MIGWIFKLRPFRRRKATLSLPYVECTDAERLDRRKCRRTV